MAVRNRVVELRTVRASDLKPNAKNWRLHPDFQRTAMQGMLDEVGYASALIARETPDGLVLIDGHLRADLTPDAEVPVLIVDLDDREADLVLATLDPISRLAESDADLATALLKDLASADSGVGALLEMLRAENIAAGRGPTGDPDAVPELPSEALSKRGEVYELGPHRAMCGDATSAEDVALLLDGGKPNLMVTDPPYGVDYDPAWRNEAAALQLLKWAPSRVGEVLNDDRVDWREAWALFAGNVAYVWHAGVHTSAVQAGLGSADFEIRSQIIWSKSNFPISRGHYHWRHEPCWYAVRKGATGAWIGDHKQTTVWEINLDKNVGGGHSTQKPVECMRRPLVNHTGDVYDPFAGTGTTVIAAEMERRRCWAMDIEPRYVDVARQRYADFMGDAKWSPTETLSKP